MKSKFYFLALAAMLAVPTMQAQRTATSKAAAMQGLTQNRHIENAVATQHTQFRAMLNDEQPIPAGMVRVTLACGDVWGDGTGYQMLLDADATAYGTVIPETGGLSTYGDVAEGVYDEFEYKIPENADGSIYTSNIVLDDAVSILIPAGTYDYCITNPVPYDRVWIASDYGMVSGRADDYVFEAGKHYIYTVELGWEGFDGVYLEVVEGGEPVVTVPTTPEEVTAEVGRHDAVVSWVDNDDAMWNLRYRVYSEDAPAGETYFWDFEEPQADDNSLPGGWTAIDADGDTYNWYHLNVDNGGAWACHSGVGHLTSASYLWGALTPDNWLVSPEVTLNGEVSFWAAGQDPSYASEVFAVYVTTGDPNDVNSYVKISDDITATGEVTEYTFDLSEYAGQKGHVAIRHYNVTDMFRLNIDDVTIGGGAVEAEWIYVNGIQALNCALNGLDEETTYEVQVQATDGEQVSDWTASYYFTTLGNTAVEEVKAEVKADNNYYNLMGQKMNANNLPAGIYIHNGQKVLVK